MAITSFNPPHELADAADEYHWYYLYHHIRPNVMYGTVTAKSPEDAIRVLNLETALGVVVDNLTVVQLATKVKQSDIERYHKLFDGNIFLQTGLSAI